MYQKIFQVWKGELEEETLVLLEEGFWGNVQKYIEKVRITLDQASEDSMQAGLSQLELQKSKFMVKDILFRRRRKIMKALILGGSEVEQVSPLELQIVKGAFRTSVDLDQLLDALLKGEEFSPEKQDKAPPPATKTRAKRGKKPKYLFVRFKTDLPQIIGVDSKTYGPFKAEDVATIPEENALPLIERDAAQEIE